MMYIKVYITECLAATRRRFAGSDARKPLPVASLLYIAKVPQRKLLISEYGFDR